MSERTVYRVDEEHGRLSIVRAAYVGKKCSWRIYRDVETGEEWKENGLHWFASPALALRDAVARYLPSRERELLRSVLGGNTAEEDFRLLVQACAMLWRLWEGDQQ